MNECLWIYDTDSTNSCRFSLGYCLKKPLLCIGVNPSTATPEKLDPTIRSVVRIAKNNHYDGWIMINLYPQRSSNPNCIHNELDADISRQNLLIIKSIIDKYQINEIWAAWGTLITKRPFLIKCLQDIYLITAQCNWITFGTISKDGHPHHPLYLNSNALKSSFDIATYINTLTKN